MMTEVCVCCYVNTSTAVLELCNALLLGFKSEDLVWSTPYIVSSSSEGNNVLL